MEETSDISVDEAINGEKHAKPINGMDLINLEGRDIKTPILPISSGKNLHAPKRRFDASFAREIVEMGNQL